MKLIFISGCLLVAALNSIAQNNTFKIGGNLKTSAAKNIQAGYEDYKRIALNIWDYAEVGFKENKSSLLLQNTLSQHGFTIEAGVAGMPTAFVASYGTGKPVIGILAEFDALPGLSQDTSFTKTPIEGRTSGHGCGHHLFGTGSVAAAIAIQQLIEAGKIRGTIKLYGTPAEEGGGGKVYMVREGLFDNADVVLHWHPGDKNEVTYSSALAYRSAKFRFYGVAAHAAASPEKGRSALDAVEAMDNMVNMMREHIPQESRIHYVITNGGKAPNVVPDFAEVFYYVRHPERATVESLFERVARAARGAAMGTETKMEYEVIDGTHDLLINKTLAADMQTNLEKVGGITYTPDEILFAQKLQSTFLGKIPSLDSAAIVTPLHTDKNQGSTDVGDVSYVVPTVGLSTATWVPGTAAHSWQAVACGGKDMGTRGMIAAAKTLAFTAIDLYLNPALIKKATDEFNTLKGDYKYKPLLGDRKPALNYRD
ncbi:MAG: Aminobenzoyl-glutamate utilization protein [Ferruginibacter sp.]|uniref:amidohydrolase n=1 Tax=Ferruginibacter sp. TaxID=1940288 RepID=UPI00265A80EE|nr:amidohydrolase [Ferruginibacter sp.]MDB5276705.1 Aminobenzoyl-glutamate utilization protein [Ferruginibacter sp.]